MKTRWIAVLLLLASLPLRGQTPFFTVPAPMGVLRVALVPAENVTASDVDVVKRALESYYGVHVTVTPPVTLAGPSGVKGPSQSIRTGARGRQVVTDSTNWEGNPFTPFTGHAGPDFDVVVGLMGYGLSTAKWTIRGITTMKGKCSVVTTYLVRQQSATEEQYRFRLAKVALHEFGHVLGLPHCGADNLAAGVQLPEYSGKTTTVEIGDPRCLMLQSTADGAQLYATTNQLCKQCHAKIKANAKPVSFLRPSQP
ncbi:MAG: hypothetical protein AVDCRST_MAG56-1073 [uncultured Cytophagales bacterium]|uniref:Peptidase M10 metallopeptidase domain-containing protein n=1 Tax=uncultured Cytophagales bacterium TaxID=158755 RepID=A0A6J4HU07_9SPHI|nr:MAG: hypothetical protein AVDCRST_MAG56-1073 [uncultured Cytophagales bacterium]